MSVIGEHYANALGENPDDVLLNDLPLGAEVIDLGYRPRPLQQILHESLKRFNVLVCHRRFGKTVFSIMEMIDKGMACEKKNPQYAYVAPTYGQAKRVAWEYVKDFTRHIPGAKANEAELRVDIPRPEQGDKVRFMLLGAENPDSLRGIYLMGVILDEYAQCDPIIWGQVIRPALSDHKGWAIFIGTPKGTNHFHNIYVSAQNLIKDGTSKNWFAECYKASETGVVDAEELLEAKSTMTEEEYDQEYECSFTAALLGAYYGKYLIDIDKKGKIVDFDFDPSVAVDTYWDLGISDSTAIWFVQRVGREIHIIDYLENAGVGLEWYAKAIQSKPYTYSNHGIPHDGAARELGTGVSRQETLRDLGLTTHIIPRQSVADGINATRVMLQKDIWFHKTNCERGIEALRNYQRKYDSKNQMFVDKPLHNWASNGADAIRMMALDLQTVQNTFNMNSMTVMNVQDYDELGG
jgi:hypothetical protein